MGQLMKVRICKLDKWKNIKQMNKCLNESNNIISYYIFSNK